LIRLKELKIECASKEENPPNVPQLRLIENLKRKVYRNKNHPKVKKCLMAKTRKELKSIESTGIRKAMKELPAKAHILGITFFFSGNM
jgi:hypothetical protein